MKSKANETLQYLRLAGALLLLVCLLCGAPVRAETAGEPWLTLAAPVREGDRLLQLQLSQPVMNLRLNVFSQQESLADTAEHIDDTLTITLQRALRAEEILLIVAEGSDAQGQEVSCRLEASVESLFQRKLDSLRSRVDNMWPLWQDLLRNQADTGTVYLPRLWKDVPFHTWPDEAPELIVAGEENRTLLRFSESVPADWRVCTGADLPIVYTDCEWDEAAGAWVAQAAFESVFLISDMTEERVGISIEYPAANQYLASYPVLDWEGTCGDQVAGFNCYGWGNARSFEGGMTCQVLGESQWYAEYTANGLLSAYYALHLDCQYDAEDRLVAGTPPEGYVPPVIH